MGIIEGTNSLKIVLDVCVHIHVLLYVRVGIGLLDLTWERVCKWEKSFELQICFCQFGGPEATLCGGQDAKIQLLTDSALTMDEMCGFVVRNHGPGREESAVPALVPSNSP